MRALDEPLPAMAADGLVPLYSSGSIDELRAVAQALVGAGVSTFEVTLRSPGTLDALPGLVAWCEEEALPLTIGAGTVLDAVTAETAIAAGARFVFSPVVSAEVAMVCRDAGVPHIAGCATPTEVHVALELGCPAVKLFPAEEIGGPGFLRALRSVLPDVVAIPSGGIGPDPAVMRPWFEAGAAAVAMGSRLFTASPVADAAELQRRLSEAVAAVAAAREGSVP